MPKLETKPAAAPAETSDGDEPEAAPKPTRRKAKVKPDLETYSLADVQDKINILYYGDAGTGKTTNCASMANLGRVLWFNAESGIKAGPLRQLGVNVDNIQLVPKPGDKLTFPLIEDWYWKIKGDLDDDPDSWIGNVWDSTTEIHKALLDGVVEHAQAKAERAGKDRDRFFVDLADYGVMTEQMRLLLRRFRDLPCHFAATALPRRDADDDGKVIYRPAMTPALRNDILGFMDIVCWTEVAEVGGEDEYRGLFRPAGKYRGKDRFGVLPRKLVDPGFDRVQEYVDGKLELATDPVMEAAKALRAKLKGERGDPEEEQDQQEPEDQQED